MNKEDNLDERIRTALEDRDTREIPSFEEPSPFREFFQLFQTERAAWNYMALAITFIFLSLAVNAAIVFFDKPDMAFKLAAAVVFIVAMNVVLVVKVYVWLEMNKLRLLREIKRLELQIAYLRKESEK